MLVGEKLMNLFLEASRYVLLVCGVCHELINDLIVILSLLAFQTLQDLLLMGNIQLVAFLLTILELLDHLIKVCKAEHTNYSLLH